MRYSIFYLIKGDAKKYRNKLVRGIGPKFGENYVLDSKLPAHITLKVPFEIRDIKKVEKILDKFSKKHKSKDIEIVGFNHFKGSVAFLKFNFPKYALKVQRELITELEKLKDVSINEHDKKWTPHATISYCNNRENFDKIWDFLNKLEVSHFKLKFDNITIMKKTGKYWKIHKEFKLK